MMDQQTETTFIAHRKLLIVDDQKDLTNNLKIIFELKDYEVEIADSALETKKIIETFTPHVALIDVHLGIESGIELMQKIKEVCPTTLCVMITAYAKTETAIQAIHKGAYDYLVKPIEMSELFVILNRCFEQLRLEHEKKLAESTLIESQENLQTLFDTLDDLLFILDHKGSILHVNPVVPRQLHYSFEELTTEMSILDVVHPNELETTHHILEGLLTEQIKTYPITLITQQGIKIPVEIKFSNGQWGGQHVFFGIARDITERVRAEETVKQSEMRLYQSQKLEAIGTLAGGIAHDFNNILQGIMMTIEVLKEETNHEMTSEDDFQKIINFSKRGAELVSQILTFSRQHSIAQKSVSFVNVTKEVLKMIRATIPSTVRIEQELDPECHPILGNATQLYQILINLFTNAEYAMRENGGTLTVLLQEVHLDAKQSQVLNLEEGIYNKLIVQDTGKGISSDTKELIFDPFFTTKPFGEGSGMGLSVVHGIIQSHQGVITVDSEEGKWTRFEIHLPSLLKEDKQLEHEIPVESQKGTERILLIDDEVDVTQMVEKNLQRFGYSVVTIHDSLEALTIFQAQPNQFDLVITDQTMPKLSGDELAQELLRIREDLPIILLTGFSHKLTLQGGHSHQIKNTGIKQFLMKPLQAEKLNQTIRQVMDGVNKL